MNHHPGGFWFQVPPDAFNVSEIAASPLTHSFHVGLDSAGKFQDGAKIPSRVKGQYYFDINGELGDPR